MTYRARYDEAHLARLLGALPPAPAAWVEAAQELPRAQRQMDDLVTRAEADQELRAAVVAELETAFEAAACDIDTSFRPVNGNESRLGSHRGSK